MVEVFWLSPTFHTQDDKILGMPRTSRIFSRIWKLFKRVNTKSIRLSKTVSEYFLHTYVSSKQFWWYFCLSLVLYFDTAILSDHFSKQTARNPGCSVMQDGAVIVSCRTSSEDNASIHPSISLQHWAS